MEMSSAALFIVQHMHSKLQRLQLLDFIIICMMTAQLPAHEGAVLGQYAVQSILLPGQCLGTSTVPQQEKEQIPRA